MSGQASYGSSHNRPVVPGAFAQFLPMILDMFRGAQPQFAGATGQGPSFGSTSTSNPLDIFAQLLGPSSAAYGQGLATGFAPDILSSIEGKLRPQLENSFAQGSAAINQAAADRGTLSGTGTVSQIGDFRGQLEGGLLEQLAGIEGALGQGAQQSRTSLAAMPFQLLPGLLGASLAGQQAPLQAFQVLAQLLGAVPTGQRGSSTQISGGGGKSG